MKAMRSTLHGVLAVNKPVGPTSHDVVVWARRALGTRAVGHAGTLDPVAAGLLVLLVGEATKLAPYLTAADKVYEATFRLGEETNTLDTEGTVAHEAPIPAGLTVETVGEVAQQFIGRILQRPPAHSAIKVRGEPLYARARRGENVEPEPREVEVRSLDVLSVEPNAVHVRVSCGCGFYVRSLARDLALALGTRGYLIDLTRTQSGGLKLEDAVPGDLLREAAKERDPERQGEWGQKLVSLFEACSSLPRARLNPEGETRARRGQPILSNMLDFPGAGRTGGPPVALGTAAGDLVAIARRSGNHFKVMRGFNP
jgi:tRNA pseudouridine55 synthase